MNFLNAQQMAAMQQAGQQQQANPYAQQQQANPILNQQQANPYAQQQANPYAQQQANPYAQQQAYGQQPNPYGQQQPQQAYPVAQSQGGVSGTTIFHSFSDGTMVGYDRLRREMMLTGKTGGALSTTSMRHIPCRPLPGQTGADGKIAIKEEPKKTPVTKQGTMVKLGYKKGAFGSISWQPRHFTLGAEEISYSKDGGVTAINTIKLTKGMTTRVVDAKTAGRKDRFEDGDHGGVSGLMTASIGSMMSEFGSPVGRDNCVELVVPVQVGGMLNTITDSSVAGLAFGGGMQQVKNQKGRTYYMQCSDRREAEEWCSAIDNNIKALADPKMGEGKGKYGFVDGMLNTAMKMSKDIELSKDPTTSLQWYKEYLGTVVSMEELFAGLCQFYDELDRNGVPHN